MKVLCYLTALLLYVIDLIGSQQLNLGTVLFTKEDLTRKCWTKTEQTLLCARQMIEGVLPDPENMDITQSGAVNVLLQYFRTCFEAIGHSTDGNTQNVLFPALSDAIGGYLRAYILPVIRRAYYAGQVDYAEAREIFQFYDKIKHTLRTNGAGWSKPQGRPLRCKIMPLDISFKPNDGACDNLYFTEETKRICHKCSRGSGSQDPSPSLRQYSVSKTPMKSKLRESFRFGRSFSCAEQMNEVINNYTLSNENMNWTYDKRKHKNRKRICFSSSTDDSLKHHYLVSSNESHCMKTAHKKQLDKRRACHKCAHTTEPASVSIPLPILDDRETPHAIGLPFKDNPLTSLYSPNSACILVRYYTTVINCLASKTRRKCDIDNFSRQFQSWMTSEIFPHLNNEEWYPAFGSVLRIDETIKSLRSVGKCKINAPKATCCTCRNELTAEDIDNYGWGDPNAGDMGSRNSNHRFLTFGMSLVVILWILTFCYCCCHYFQSCKNDTGINTAGSSMKTQEKSSLNTSNSSILQCFIKFFKRNCSHEPAKPCGKTPDQCLHKNIPKDADEHETNKEIKKNQRATCEHQVNDSSAPSDQAECGGKERGARCRNTVCMPANLSTRSKEGGVNTHWPFSDYHYDINVVKPCPERWLESNNRNEEFIDNSSQNRRSKFKTLWRRPNTPAKTSESYTDGSMITVSAVKGHVPTCNKLDYCKLMQHKCSCHGGRERNNHQKVIFARKSHSLLDHPASYNYSCQSSDSYSSSQSEVVTSPHLYDGIAACHNAFTRTSRAASSQEPRGSESDPDMTSYSESVQSSADNG